MPNLSERLKSLRIQKNVMSKTMADQIEQQSNNYFLLILDYFVK